jgi:dihydroorotate dehydrogenase
LICPSCGYTDNKKTRSIQQNKAYFGLAVNMIANHLGYDKEDMHKALAEKFLGTVEIKFGKETLIVPKSTKNLTTVQFIEYTERVQRWAAEFLELNIPCPNEGAPVGYK